MASTTNNSGINGENPYDFGPDEKWDDETDEQFRIRMDKKRQFEVLRLEHEKTKTPRSIG